MNCDCGTATSKCNVNCVQQGLRNGLQDGLLVQLQRRLETATVHGDCSTHYEAARACRTAYAERHERCRIETPTREKGATGCQPALGPNTRQALPQHVRRIASSRMPPRSARTTVRDNAEWGPSRMARSPSPPSMPLAHGASPCLGTKGRERGRVLTLIVIPSRHPAAS